MSIVGDTTETASIDGSHHAVQPAKTDQNNEKDATDLPADLQVSTRGVAARVDKAGESGSQRIVTSGGVPASAHDSDGMGAGSTRGATSSGAKRGRGSAGVTPKSEHAVFAQSAQVLVAWTSKQDAGGSVLYVCDWSRLPQNPVVKMLGVKSLPSESRVALSPDGRLLLRADGEILDLHTRKRQTIDLGATVHEPGGEGRPGINEIGFSPDGVRVAVLVGSQAGSRPDDGTLRGTIQIVDFPSGKVLCRFRAGEPYKARIGFSADGKQVVGGDPTRHILRRDATTGEIIKRYEPALDDQIYDVAISPDGRFVAASQRKGDMLLWEAETGRLAHRIHLVDAKGYAFHSLRFSPNGGHLAAKDRFRVSVHDTATGRLVGEINKEGQLRWSADGRTLAIVTETDFRENDEIIYPSLHEWDSRSGRLRSLSVPASAEETSWGRPVEGVQMRLRVEKAKWPTGVLPKLKVDLRNAGGNEFKSLKPATCYWELELDGQWYWSKAQLRGRTPILPFGPGTQHNDLTMSLEKHMKWVSKKGDEPLELDPGRHTVRVGICMLAVEQDDGLLATWDPEKRGEVIKSLPIEIEVLPAAKSRVRVERRLSLTARNTPRHRRSKGNGRVQSSAVVT
jgi:WD40 repeat protein